MKQNTNSICSIDFQFRFHLGLPALELGKLIRWLIPIAIPLIRIALKNSGALAA